MFGFNEKTTQNYDLYDVKVGRLCAGEIDFVCSKTGKKTYEQVSYLIANDETRKREFGYLCLCMTRKNDMILGEYIVLY